MTVTRVDPLKIDTTKKEGVADAILNIMYGRVSGRGKHGEVVYGSLPSRRFVSGFLLPRRDVDDGDEVTSPIWVSSHGLDFQVHKGVSGTVRIRPSFALYVRILPSDDDVRNRSDCRLLFRVKKDVSTRARIAINERLREKWAELEPNFKSRNKCPQWGAIEKEVQEQVYLELGLARSVVMPPPADGLEQSPVDSDDNAPYDAVELSSTGNLTLRDELYDSLDVPQKWLRLDLELPQLELDLTQPQSVIAQAIAAHESAMDATIQTRLLAWVQSTDTATGGKLWGYAEHTRVPPSKCHDWQSFLAEQRSMRVTPALPDISAAWDIVITSDWLDPTRLNVHAALENRSNVPVSRTEADPSLFDVSIELDMPAGVHAPLKLARVEPSYRYNQYLHYAAIGFNGGVHEYSLNDRIQLRTTWTPRYQQPRIVPLSYPNVERNVRRLSTPEGVHTLSSIPLAFESWLARVPHEVDWARGLEGNPTAIGLESEEFSRHLEKWAREKDSIAAGIAILAESQRFWNARGAQSDKRAAPFEAWLAMNEAMADYMKERLRLEEDTATWRLFQLAFILANIPALVSRMPEYMGIFDESRDDAVTLLYFATGGGKSEAFFGLLLYALLLDRLRGKCFGVTAMIRYPLRLLTIQQAQRASKVLGKAELVRQRHEYGGEPFSIGFWVGSGGSPNRLNERGVADVPEISTVTVSEAELLAESEKYSAAVKAWRKLVTCPFCSAQTGLRRFKAYGGMLAHVCTNSGCSWNDQGTKPLPFYIVDDDVYDYAPSVLLGTVDKLALIGHSARTIRRILGMLGTAPWQKEQTERLHMPTEKELREGPERHGCRTLFPAYADGHRLFHDPHPSLLIQDEAHLLDEGLGTFAGLFESTLDAMFEGVFGALKNTAAVTPEGKRRRAKVIAASATVSEPERQLEHLYQRKVPEIQFPYPGPDIYHSFYAAPEEPREDEVTRGALSGPQNIETRSRLARIYSAVMTNGRPHTSTTVAVLANFHLTITDLFEGLLSQDAARQEQTRQQILEHLSPSKVHDTVADKIRAATPAELATLVDLHRISLTYVTNKKGGDQIMAAEGEEVRKLHEASGYSLESLNTRLITGSVEQGEIQDTVAESQRRVKPGQELPPIADALRSIVATSAVSHGVDVEELNSMFFAGMPSDIAEYIQASSRVGRTHVGFCVLVPTPQRRRDRYIVEVFDIFHRFLERMVQPAAIDRWAENAVRRVLPSIFQACVCGVVATRKFLDAPDDKKANWRPNDSIQDFADELERDFKSFHRELTRFAELAIGLKDHYAPEGEGFYRGMVSDRMKNLLDEMMLKGNKNSTLSEFFRGKRDTLLKPMTSLRDVDQAGTIRLARKDEGGAPMYPEDVRHVMALIRRGYAEEGDYE